MALMTQQPAMMLMLSATARFLAQHRAGYDGKPKPHAKQQVVDCQCGACVEAREAIATATGRKPDAVMEVIDIDGRLAAERPQILQTDEGFIVCGLAVVDAEPIRRMAEAKQIAERIAREPASYLSACVQLRMEGIRDLRLTAND